MKVAGIPSQMAREPFKNPKEGSSTTHLSAHCILLSFLPTLLGACMRPSIWLSHWLVWMAIRQSTCRRRGFNLLGLCRCPRHHVWHPKEPQNAAASELKMLKHFTCLANVHFQRPYLWLLYILHTAHSLGTIMASSVSWRSQQRGLWPMRVGCLWARPMQRVSISWPVS